MRLTQSTRLTPPRQPRSDRAVAGIIASNAFTLGIALWQHWSVFDLMWPFLIQSLVIGWYARKRLMLAPRLSASNLTINGRPVTDPEQARRFMGVFFLLHYGLFHLGYVIFLLVLPAIVGQGAGDGATLSNAWLYAASGIAFWLAHRASHRQHLRDDLAHTRSVAVLMGMPYLRVVPMHLTIVLAAVWSGSTHPAIAGIALFVALKTLVDIATHVLEHRLLQKGDGGN